VTHGDDTIWNALEAFPVSLQHERRGITRTWAQIVGKEGWDVLHRWIGLEVQLQVGEKAGHVWCSIGRAGFERERAGRKDGIHKPEMDRDGSIYAVEKYLHAKKVTISEGIDKVTPLSFVTSRYRTIGRGRVAPITMLEAGQAAQPGFDLGLLTFSGTRHWLVERFWKEEMFK
jgi:hypothetical protein